jgi:PAS domain S-box-containing protein
MPTPSDVPQTSPDDIRSPAFRRALDAVPTGLIAVEPSGAIAFLNSTAERMFLYERNQWQNQMIETLVPAVYRAEHSARAAAFLRAPAHRPMGMGRDLMALRRDGTEFPVEIGLSPLPTSGGAWTIASVVDLSERKRLELEVRESHERVHAYWEAASEGLITVDASGIIEMVNEAIQRIFGYNRLELVGQPLELIIPENRRCAHAEKRERYFEQPTLRPMGVGQDLLGRRKDGTEFPVTVGLNVARIGDRTVAIGFVTDISEKKRLEEQSAVLGTLVDLQQQLSTSGKRQAVSSDCDPLTSLDTRAIFEQTLERTSANPSGRYVVIYSIQRMQQMNTRFGRLVANRIIVFASQYIANSLKGEGDHLFRWDGATFVALVTRDSTVFGVQREIAEVCGKRLEYFVENAGGNSLVVLALQANVLGLSQKSMAEAVAEIERVAGSR